MLRLLCGVEAKAFVNTFAAPTLQQIPRSRQFKTHRVVCKRNHY